MYRSYLRRITREGGDNNFVIITATKYDEYTGKPIEKFIQFAGWKGKEEVLLDIPLHQLTEDEIARLRGLLESYPNFELEELYDTTSGEEIESISGYIDVDGGAELADRIFKEVLGFPEGYKVNIELNLE